MQHGEPSPWHEWRAPMPLRGTTSRRLWLTLGALVAIASSNARAQGGAAPIPRYRVRILGVFDESTGQPLEGADVIDVLTGTSARTTATGTVPLAFLPDGGGLVRIRKLGFETFTTMVSIAPDDTLPLTITLHRLTELSAVAVVDSAPRYISPALRGFEERRRTMAGGQFIPESVIRKEEDRYVASFWRAHLPTAVIIEGRGGSVGLGRSPQCGAGGRPAVIVDGVLLAGVVNLAEYPLTTLAGIEYYPTNSVAPAQFGGTSLSCGAVLLWTREK